MPESALPFVSCTIANYNGGSRLIEAIQSVLAQDYPPNLLDLIVVDDCSSDDSVNSLRGAFPESVTSGWLRMVVNTMPGGAAHSFSEAARHRSSLAKYVFRMDNDVVLDSSAVRTLVATLESDASAYSAGAILAVGDSDRAQLLGLNRPASWSRLLTTWVDVGLNMPIGQVAKRTVKFDAVNGASVLIRAELLERCGYFHEAYFAYHEDVDLQFRMGELTGGHALFVPKLIGKHYLSTSGGSNAALRIRYFALRNSLLFARRHLHGAERVGFVAQFVFRAPFGAAWFALTQRNVTAGFVHIVAVVDGLRGSPPRLTLIRRI